MSSSTASLPRGRPRGRAYLIIANISKRKNVQLLLQTAAAFDCSTVFVAGQRKFDFEPTGTDVPSQLKHHIASGKMEIVRFEKLQECVAHIKGMKGSIEASTSSPSSALPSEDAKGRVKIIGVEIDDSSVDLEGEPFEGDVAFMMGNEGQGMNSKQMSVCDGFIRIAQYGAGTASLNVSVAASVVLHRFFHWSRCEGVGDNSSLAHFDD